MLQIVNFEIELAALDELLKKSIFESEK